MTSNSETDGVRITLTCAHCGKVFERYRSQPAKYCSGACYRAALPDGRVTATCPCCGREFRYYPSWPRKYCSQVCSGKANISRNIPDFVPTAYMAACEQCGKDYLVKPGAVKGRFCSLACWGSWSSLHLRGETHPKTGKTGKTGPRFPRIAITCPVCGKVFEETPVHAKRRRCCSRECYARHMSESGEHSGPNNPLWTGGYAPYYGPSWHPARRKVQAQHPACVDCGTTPEALGRELDVHHVVPFRLFGTDRHEDANQISNLVALCPTCHTRREWASGRSLLEEPL